MKKFLNHTNVQDKNNLLLKMRIKNRTDSKM